MFGEDSPPRRRRDPTRLVGLTLMPNPNLTPNFEGTTVFLVCVGESLPSLQPIRQRSPVAKSLGSFNLRHPGVIHFRVPSQLAEVKVPSTISNTIGRSCERFNGCSTGIPPLP